MRENSPFALEEIKTTVDAGKFNVTLKDGKKDVDVVKFLKDNAASLPKPQTKQAGTDGNLVFDQLDHGYYYLTSTSGTLVTLDSNTPTVDVQDKNEAPTLTKLVQEDSNQSWGAKNTASVGETVNFKITIAAKQGAKNYVVQDALPAGMTYNGDLAVAGAAEATDYQVNAQGQNITVTFEKAYLDKIAQNTDIVITYSATVNHSAGAAEATDYQVNAQGQNITVTFEKAYLDKIAQNTDIVITYSATVNHSAVIGAAGNVNKAYMTYGASGKTADATTTTYTYGFDLVKTTLVGDPGQEAHKLLNGAAFKLYDAKASGKTADATTTTYTYGFDLVKTTLVGDPGQEAHKLLNGAAFKLYDAKKGGNEIVLIQQADGSYHPLVGQETAADRIDMTQTAKVRINGLDNGTYYLEEVQAPAGYNKVKERIEVKIENANLDADVNDTDYNGGGIEVVNRTGAELPSTGGMGTTMFYVLGAVLVLGAAIALVAKRRTREQ